MAKYKSIYMPRFTIGEDAFDLFGSEMGKYGKKIVVIHGEKAWAASKEYVVPAIEKAGLEMTADILYGKEATYENLEKLVANPAVQEADMVLGVGGGKCLDTVKLAADRLGKPVFTVPSIASNCSPVTKISIMYNADGSFKDIPVLSQPPVHCFINPRIVMAAPLRFLIAGIGDAEAKHIESSWSAKAGERLDYGSEMGIMAGGMCFYPLVRESVKAVEDFKAGIASEELENVILNVVVSPGIVSVSVHPWYNGGVAHSLFYGLTKREHIEKNYLHGEVVSYGTLVSMMLDEDYANLKASWDLSKTIGLPTCLADLQLTREDELEDVLEATLANQEMVHTPYPVSKEDIRAAILKLDDYQG